MSIDRLYRLRRNTVPTVGPDDTVKITSSSAFTSEFEIMNRQFRSVVMNSLRLRQCRLKRGWSQLELAKRAGYTDRLIRKAETNGSLDLMTIRNLAEALSVEGEKVSVSDLTLDILAVAKHFVYGFDVLGRDMLPHVKSFLAKDFVFFCAGDKSVAPFVGTWAGPDGYQQWLNLFFDLFTREPNKIEVRYTVGENTVVARWLETGFVGGHQCGPIWLNMHFHFEDGLIQRVDDEYDTQAGADAVAEAKRRLIKAAS